MRNENGSEIGPNLPEKVNNHCAASINSSYAILTGGAIFGDAKETQIFDVENFAHPEPVDFLFLWNF